MGEGRTHCIRVPECGLVAFIAIDSTTLGPAAGGVRTMAYASEQEAEEDARRLARAMTQKCALAGLAAGGGKAVVMAHPGLVRAEAFKHLGEAVEGLGGTFRTAGDVGTGPDDLAMMAQSTRWVHRDEGGLSQAVADGLLACLRAAVEHRNAPPIEGLSVAVQGCGAIGTAVTHALVDAGLSVHIADIDDERARRLSERSGAQRVAAANLWHQPADVISPCALGGVVTHELLATISKAKIICGAANNILASESVEGALAHAGITWVPDVIASAGAVVRGIAQSVMGIEDPSNMVTRLGDIAREVLEESRASRRLASEVIASRVQQGLSQGGVALEQLHG